MSYTAPERPVRPRNAASLVILRGRGPDAEVLLGKRASRHRFMPNVFVFPGGRVDRADAAIRPLHDLRPEVMRPMARAWGARYARALANAAARETHEETGLVFGALDDGRLRPDLAAFDYIARAITPPASPIRFHARFFLADAADAEGTVRGNGELLDLQWFPVREALRLPLVDVTEFVMGEVLHRLHGRRRDGIPLFSYRHGRASIRYE